MYKKINNPNMPEFKLSKKYQVLWLDPDFYLTPGSFAQHWLARVGVHPKDITEETVAEHIFTFLATSFGDFSSVILVEDTAIPSLEELGVETTGEIPNVRVPQILELVVAPGTTFNEYGEVEGVYRTREAETSITIFNGGVDTLELTQRLQMTDNDVQNIEKLIARALSGRGSVGPLEVGSFSPWINNDAPDGSLTRVEKLIYRDSEGEPHTFEYFTEETYETLSNIQAEITQIEARLAEARTA